MSSKKVLRKPPAAVKKPSTPAVEEGTAEHVEREIPQVKPAEPQPFFVTLLAFIIQLAGLGFALWLAYTFRLHAVTVYGRIIHEFDPWFNFRATQYMEEHGIFEFFNWFDTMSWYPIGRHIGSTTYPGLQITSTLIYRFLNLVGMPMSLNDVCVFVPAVFGALCTFFTFLLSREISGSTTSGVFAALFMAILPAHLMRSVAGGYDNESIALAAMVLTFWVWLRSIRPGCWYLAPLTGLSYIYMVAAWGGYTFVINMLGLHAGFLLLVGRYSDNLHQAYSIFYVIGTYGAMQFPIVGWQPLQSMEQMMPLLVFLGMQVFRYMYHEKEKQAMTPRQFNEFRVKVLIASIVAGIVLLCYLSFTGWLGPLSNRIRSLFIPHTRTGNPLVDSVSEHQATGAHYYWQYFYYVYYLAPLGFFLLFQDVTDAKLFGILYTVCTYYFSHKMVRLLLLLSPPAAMTAGMFLWFVVKWSLIQIRDARSSLETPAPTPASIPSRRSKTNRESFQDVADRFRPFFPIIALLILFTIGYYAQPFYWHCDMMAQQMSHPQILVQGRNSKGEPVIIDDFMQAYWWLRDHTPPESRIMAWWDYGYQINGVANRTTIADGNTWNHEHIALLGKALVSPEKEAWRIARHLADYVLVWTTRFAGMYGDDLAKMPHLANIAGSVYPEVSRTGYYMDQNQNPSDLMRESILYKLSVHRLVPNSAPLTYYKEAYTSPNKMVRIYKILNTAPVHPFGTYPPQIQTGQFRG